MNLTWYSWSAKKKLKLLWHPASPTRRRSGSAGYPSTFNLFYPPGSKCKALRLGVHLILLYFIRISLSTPETFFLFGWWKVEGGWCPTFLVFNFLYNTMVHTLDIEVYIYIYNCAQQISCGFYIFNKLESCPTFFKITMVGWFFQK